MGAKLEIPKNKRIYKEVEKEYERHRYQTPQKSQRRLSLF
jgi:hypothetical protein